MRAPLALLLLLACATPGPARPPPQADDAPRRVLDRFTAALEGSRWDEAYPLLAARWRGRVTPARLAADLAASGAVGAEALGRVRALLGAGARLEVAGDAAALPVGEGKAARLVREGQAWRGEALE